jgi:hypothetical protein
LAWIDTNASAPASLGTPGLLPVVVAVDQVSPFRFMPPVFTWLLLARQDDAVAVGAQQVAQPQPDADAALGLDAEDVFGALGDRLRAGDRRRRRRQEQQRQPQRADQLRCGWTACMSFAFGM